MSENRCISCGEIIPEGQQVCRKCMEKKKPFFSVIVPEHNSAAFMRKGLDSIKAQDMTDYELIIICDSCTDNTAEIAREYTDKVLEVNFGAAGLSRNAGLDIAQGEWILFMDDDDWWLHEFAFGMIADCLMGLDKDYDILAYSFIHRHKGYAFQVPEHLWIAIWNKAWRRSFIGDYRFPDWKHSDDKKWAEDLHPKANKIMIWDQPFYYYNYLRKGSIADKVEKGEIDPHEYDGK